MRNREPQHWPMQAPPLPAEETTAPPKTKYRYTLQIDGNSHDEIERELLVATRGGYLLDSDAYTRDSFDVTGGRTHSTLEHRNPDQTPERYDAALAEWSAARRAARAVTEQP